MFNIHGILRKIKVSLNTSKRADTVNICKVNNFYILQEFETANCDKIIYTGTNFV